MPRWAQYAGGATLLSLALAAAGVSMYMNIVSGLAVAVELAIIFAVADIGKIALQIIRASIIDHPVLKASWIVASVVSALCATNVLATFMGDRLNGAQHELAATAQAQLQVVEIEKSIANAQASAEDERKNKNSPGCGKNCQALLARVDALRAELATARGKLAAKPAPRSNGLSDMLADASGADRQKAAAIFVVVLLVAALLVGELFSQMAYHGAIMVHAAAMRPEPAKKPARQPKAAEPEEAATKPQAGSRAYYLDRLDRSRPDLAARVRAGELSANAAAIEAGLRKAKPKAVRTAKAQIAATPEAIAEHLAGIARKASKKKVTAA
jgi:hypothetical protein